MKNKIFIIIGFIFFLFCFAVFYTGLKKPNVYTPILNEDTDLPNFVSNDFFSGDKVFSEQIFKKKIITLSMYGHHGVPLVGLSILFLILLKNKNIEMIGVNYKDNIDNARAFLQELGNPYSKILSDHNGVLSIELGAYGVPETFIVNQEKKIIKKIIGPINEENYKEILKLIK